MSSDAVYEDVQVVHKEKITVVENCCYATVDSTIGKAKSSKEIGSDKKLKVIIITVSLTMLLLIVSAVGACIVFAVEMNQLKYETAALNRRIQQLNTALSVKGQKLTTSIDMLFQKVAQNYSTLESITQLLTNDVQELNASLLQQGNLSIIQLLNIQESLKTFQQDASQNYSAFESITQLLSTNIQELNSSIETFQQHASQNHSALESEIQLLQSFYSCASLPPYSPSGYYWVRANGSVVRVYCDMTRTCGGVTGGWMRVAYLDMTNSSQQCPSGLLQRIDSNIRTCAVYNYTRSCSSVLYGSHGIHYSQVCGKIRGYYVNSPDGFDYRPSSVTIDSNYVDGVSLTHGNTHHIWTFASYHTCPCGNPPPFVNNGYFCDGFFKDFNNPIWDGEGCLNTCCTFNNPPWFHRQLTQPTTDDIEMRLCRSHDRNDEDVTIDIVEIYIH